MLNEEQINELKKKYGKDFKKDIEEHMVLWDEFFMFSFEKEKKIFEIVKIEKDFDAKKYFRSILNISVVLEKFNYLEKEDSRRTEILGVMKVLNDDDVIPLKEGDTLNIRVLDFQQSIPEGISLMRSIANDTVLRLISSLNFNFTFLIELDPL